jgi:hypothetical protein
MAAIDWDAATAAGLDNHKTGLLITAIRHATGKRAEKSRYQ